MLLRQQIKVTLDWVYRQKTYEEIAAEHGVSKQWVLQVVHQMLNRLGLPTSAGARSPERAAEVAYKIRAVYATPPSWRAYGTPEYFYHNERGLSDPWELRAAYGVDGARRNG